MRAVPRSKPQRFGYGVLPPAFFDQVHNRLVAHYRAGTVRVVPRT
jgi:hypothetical protein